MSKKAASRYDSVEGNDSFNDIELPTKSLDKNTYKNI
jgi:hypothetical protein